MIFIKSIRNVPILVFQGYIYNLDSKIKNDNDIRAFRCKKRAYNGQKGCSGSLKINKNNQILQQKAHNHDADFNECERLVSMYKIREEAEKTEKKRYQYNYFIIFKNST